MQAHDSPGRLSDVCDGVKRRDFLGGSACVPRRRLLDARAEEAEIDRCGSKVKMVRTILCHHRMLKNSLTLTPLTHNKKS